MTTYSIDYSDPLRIGFSVPPGGFDGPGGALANTSLRLYGRGALEWGEAVDENLVRLTENFAGASAPVVPVAGQLWLRQALYVKNGASFFRWNVTTQVWAALSVTTTAGTIGAYGSGLTIGQYVYSTADAKLYRWDSPYKQASATWMPRELTVQTTNPTTQVPIQDLLFYDEYTQEWVTPRATTVGPALPGNGVYDGQLFYDTSTGILYIWNEREGTWNQILGPANEVGAPPGGTTIISNGNIDMQSTYTIVNVPTPTNLDLDHVANVQYVQNYVASAGSNYVPITGPSTMTGVYTVVGTLALSGVGSKIDMNNLKIEELATPTAGTDATNKTYVDGAITAAIGALGIPGGASVPVINYGGTPKDGDIRTFAPNIVEIYSFGGWRRVFPAQWV